MQTDLFQEIIKEKEVLVDMSELFDITILPKKEISSLSYSFQPTVFGEFVVASSKSGIHWLAFVSSWREGLTDLSMAFPNVNLDENEKKSHKSARKLFEEKTPKKKIKIVLSGTDFQHQVWQELLKIPFGKTTSYGEIAQTLNLPIGASRAIGTAVGKNPIAYLIPCHRVIQLSGKLGGYRWGIERKKEILLWESKLKTV